MKKINTSLACPKCNSSNVEVYLEFRDEKVKHIDEIDTSAKIITRQKVYNCKCNNCRHNYIVEHGMEKYVLFKKPSPINCLGDIELLATYDTESGFEHSYKICSLTSSPYDKNSDLKEPLYLMLIEGEKYPIIISKQTVNEMIACPNKAKELVINTIQGRHR